MRADQIQKKKHVEEFLFLLNINLKDTHAPPELVKTRHLGTEHFPTSQRVPTNRH